MSINCLLISVAILLQASPSTGVQGHPSWWWDCQDTDFIVEGTITYDPTNYYEITPVGLQKTSKKYYLMVGKVKIDRVLFINKYSQYLESYQQYLKNLPNEHSVLIPAMRRVGLHGPPMLQPILGLEIVKGSTILNLSQVYLFPFGDLQLNSAVPIEDMNEALEMVNRRAGNFISK